MYIDKETRLLIQTLAKTGKKQHEIATELGVDRKTVKRWSIRNNLEAAPKERTPKFNERFQKCIKKFILKLPIDEPITPTAVAKMLNKEFEENFSFLIFSISQRGPLNIRKGSF